jgi:hypothetical protein
MVLAKPIYLYIKISPLGLNYLGKTTKNPYKYKGSGIVWTRHLSTHNISSNDIETRVIYSTSDKKQFSEYALKVSNKLNVVNSENWANLTNEEGQGGDTWDCLSEQAKQNFIDATKRPKSIEHKRKIGLASLGRISTQRKPVIQLSLTGEIIAEYESMTVACRTLGKTDNRASDIKNCIDGGRSKKQKGKWITLKCYQAFGYKWKYKTIEK